MLKKSARFVTALKKVKIPKAFFAVIALIFILLISLFKPLQTQENTLNQGVDVLEETTEKIGASPKTPEQEKIIQEFRSVSKRYKDRIPLTLLYNYYTKLGSTAMLDVIEEDKYCHDKGHNVGRVIYNRTQDLSQSIKTCSSRCTTGCFHGVLMELFQQVSDKNQDEYIRIEQVSGQIKNICENAEAKNRVGKGVCIHGVGHALAFLASYDIQKALTYCNQFEDKGAVYYCATGVFMERNTIKGQEDMLNADKYYPCSSSDFPAACYRYKFSKLFSKNDPESARNYCMGLANPEQRHGCFHGLGFSYFKLFEKQPKRLDEICGKGDPKDKEMCIEGAVGVISVFNKEAALKICDSQITQTEKITCTKAFRVSNFGMGRDFSNYYIKGFTK